MINMMIEIAATVIDVVFMIWFISRFHNISVFRKPLSLIWGALFLVYQLLIDQLLHGFELITALGVIIVSVGYSLTLQRKKYLWSIFAGMLYVIVAMLSISLVYSVFSIFIKNIDVAIYGTKSFLRIIYLLVCKLIQFGFYQLLLQIFKKEKTLAVSNGVFSFAFTFATAVGLGFLMKLAIEYPTSEIEIITFVLAFILVLLNLILFVMINQVQSLLKSKYDLMLLQDRMRFEKSRMEEASAIWANIRQVKHDLKNHFAVMSGHLKEGNFDSCQAYVSKLYSTVETMGCLIQSGNSVIDYLINSKLACLEGVTVLVSGYVGNYSDIDDVDLACILGNILDNAIEAQEKLVSEKRIELLFLYRKSSRIIICKNTIDKSVLQNNKEMKSTKDSPELHGIGHQIVETTVGKYNGLIDYFEDSGMFGVQIVIPDAQVQSEP